MSSEQSVTEVEETKQQIRAALSEIAELSKADIAPQEFQSEFLPRVVTSLAAVAGAFWTFDPRSGLTLSCQINLQAVDFRTIEDGEKQHGRLLYRMLESPENGIMVPPHSGVTTEDGETIAGNPTDLLILGCPVRTELETVGLIEIFQRSDTSPETRRGYLAFLAQSGRLATDFYKNRQLRHFGDRQSLWTLLEEFTRLIHRSLDVRETAYTIVNEGRRLVECDRVSLAVRRGNRCVIEAVSGQDTVDKRSTTTRLLGRLATAVVRGNEPIWYSGDTADFAPQVEKAVNEYVDKSHTKLLAVYPLSRNLGSDATERESEDRPEVLRRGDRPFAALIVEQIEDGRLTESLRRRSEIVAWHAAGALGNAVDHEGIFLMSLWKLIGKSRVLVAARNLPKTLVVAGLLLALVLTLIFLPWKFEMPCTGYLNPRIRQRIHSPVDAEVRQIFVAHDSLVTGPRGDEPGTLLLQLYSPEIERVGVQLLGEAGEIQERKNSLIRQLADEEKKLTPAEITQLQSQLQETEIREDTIRMQLAVYEQQRSELDIRSPIDGVVVTWDVEETLRSRPIGRMQFLMEVVDPEGEWILELAMPEKNMGPITELIAKNRAREEANAKAEGRPLDPDKTTLPVKFMLANAPGKHFYGKIDHVQDRAEPRTDTGVSAAGGTPGGINTVLIRVRLDDINALPILSLRPGAECRAGVDCGTAPLGYVLFYDLYHFIQRNIFFRWF